MTRMRAVLTGDITTVGALLLAACVAAAVAGILAAAFGGDAALAALAASAVTLGAGSLHLSRRRGTSSSGTAIG